MSDFDLDDLRRLDALATPAPWHAGTATCCPDMGWVDGPAGKGKVCPQYEGTKTTHTLDANDAELIVAMRNLLPALLADHARLTAEVARLRGLVERATAMLEANSDKTSRRMVAADIRKEADVFASRIEGGAWRGKEGGVSERIITGRDKLGRGGQHVNDGSESSMALVIDDDAGLGVYCHTERSLHANKERARALLATLKAAQALAEAWTSGALQDRSRIADALNALADARKESDRG